MQFHNHPDLKALRRFLRKNCTPAEAALWELLKQRKLKGRKFRRQHSAGPYILDFYCPAERLAVEVDGAIHDNLQQAAHDAERTGFLKEAGIRVLRISNREVLTAPDEVLAYIASFFESSSPCKSPGIPSRLATRAASPQLRWGRGWST